jgi:type I restriction enzyme S subunit
MSFHKVFLEEVVSFYSGKSIKPGGKGIYPVYGSNGIIGWDNNYKYKNSVIIGRVGAYCGSIEYCKEFFWASDNTIVGS